MNFLVPEAALAKRMGCGDGGEGTIPHTPCPMPQAYQAIIVIITGVPTYFQLHSKHIRHFEGRGREVMG